MLLFAGVIAYFAALVACYIWSGYALSVLWLWSVVPSLWLPELSIPAAIGVGVVMSYLTTHYSSAEIDNKSLRKRALESIVFSALKPAFALGIGSIVHLWL